MHSWGDLTLANAFPDHTSYRLVEHFQLIFPNNWGVHRSTIGKQCSVVVVDTKMYVATIIHREWKPEMQKKRRNKIFSPRPQQNSREQRVLGKSDGNANKKKLIIFNHTRTLSVGETHTRHVFFMIKCEFMLFLSTHNIVAISDCCWPKRARYASR